MEMMATQDPSYYRSFPLRYSLINYHKIELTPLTQYFLITNIHSLPPRLVHSEAYMVSWEEHTLLRVWKI